MRARRVSGRKGMAVAGSAGVGEKERRGSGTGLAKGSGGVGGDAEEAWKRWVCACAGSRTRRKGEEEKRGSHADCARK